MIFENLIGNTKVKNLLSKAITSNNILHSYMFYGPEGIGKKLFAIEFAKSILCTSEIKPCGKCKSCIEFDNQNNPDFNLIEKDDKLIKIDSIRYMNKKITEKPITSNRKVYIINDADTMNKEAQNCLLKTLEEPPSYATIILIVSNENSLLNTIRSRCIKVNFSRLEQEEIKDYLKINERNDIEPEILELSDGSISKLNRIIENSTSYHEVKKFITNIENRSLLYNINNSEMLFDKEIIEELLEYINKLLLTSREIKKINCVKYIEETKKNIKSNCNYDMTIDNLIIRMWEEINEKHNRG